MTEQATCLENGTSKETQTEECNYEKTLTEEWNK